jgi:DNA invertase Pin-like site-specific DNA recombinase
MSLGERIREEGIQQGIQQGMQQGIQLGEKKGELRGIQIGEQQGKQRGVQEKAYSVAKILLAKKNMSLSEVAEITELSCDQLNEILKELENGFDSEKLH